MEGCKILTFIFPWISTLITIRTYLSRVFSQGLGLDIFNMVILAEQNRMLERLGTQVSLIVREDTLWQKKVISKLKSFTFPQSLDPQCKIYNNHSHITIVWPTFSVNNGYVLWRHDLCSPINDRLWFLINNFELHDQRY